MCSKLAQEVSIGLEDLNAVVPRISNDDVPFLIDCDSLGSQELCVRAALRSQKARVLKIRADHEQSVVVEICDHHVSFVVEGHSAR